MESSLTQLEMDAVLQLIQLRGNSADDSQVFWVNLAGKKEKVGEEIKQEEEEENREESVGETSSSSVINPEKSLEEALPRRRKKFLPIADIYRKTQPLIKNLTLKRPKI